MWLVCSTNDTSPDSNAKMYCSLPGTGQSLLHGQKLARTLAWHIIVAQSMA